MSDETLLSYPDPWLKQIPSVVGPTGAGKSWVISVFIILCRVVSNYR